MHYEVVGAFFPRAYASAAKVKNWSLFRSSARLRTVQEHVLEKRTMETEQTYRGNERRRHRMYVTRNTEYHLRDGVCVAVRDRKSGTWLPSHLALERRLSGGVRLLNNGTAIPVLEAPRVGEALYFAEEEGRELITSKLCGVERPQKRLVSQYPS